MTGGRDTVRSTVVLAGGQISYLDFRPPDPRQTVLLLHGGGVDSAELSWGEVAPRLAAAGHRVIAPDHPGHGRSPLPNWPVTQQRLLDYVAQFIDVLNLDRYVIGGLSLGGGLAIGHVLAAPERVTAVMLLDSYGLMPRLAGVRQPLSWVMQRSGVLDAATGWMATNRAALAWSMKSLIRDPARRTPELVAEILAAARQPGFTAFEQWQRDQILWNRLHTDYTPRLASIRCPTLIIHGEQDTGVPVARARAAAALIPDARLKVVAGAGHWVQRDAPDVVVGAMTDFLDRVSRGS
ncbi:MAG TPA: alpha/beta hydrolase [Mycobacterium sp.]|nr:alpha/beta hydrolase [Mycobacterium sp.]